MNQPEMPDLAQLKAELTLMRNDVMNAVKTDPDLKEEGDYLTHILDTLDEIVAKKRTVEELSMKEQISMTAHMSLFYSIIDELAECDDDEECCDDEEESCEREGGCCRG